MRHRDTAVRCDETNVPYGRELLSESARRKPEKTDAPAKMRNGEVL